MALTDFDRKSEKYHASGGVSGVGAMNVLGKPKLHPLVLLTRETVQNSWDARRPGKGAVHFSVDAVEFDRSASDYLRHIILRDAPPKAGFPFSEEIRKTAVIPALQISDRNTVGLEGPVRADEAGYEGERRYVNFLCAVGNPKEVQQKGGGTYGYGKASLYLASKWNTIVVYSRCKLRNNYESRFIVAALGKEYEHAEKKGKPFRYTGRHWWGRTGSEGEIRPIIGSEADRSAEKLGIKPLRGEETGTTVWILNPFQQEDQTLESSIEVVQKALLWYCWPKMSSHQGRSAMKFALSLKGHPIPLIEPDSHPVLRHFVALHDDILAASFPSDDAPKFNRWCTFHQQKLARLAVKSFIGEHSADPIAGEVDGEKIIPVDMPPHHVARFREPELIVDYFPGPELPSAEMGYVGILRAEDGMNNVFAEAEPPAHDAWVAERLVGKQLQWVRKAEKDLKAYLKEFLAPPELAPGEDGALLAGFSRMLGDFVPPPGSAARPEPNPRPGPPSGRRASVKIVKQELEQDGEELLALVHFEITHKIESNGTMVRAVIGAETEQGLEDSPPEGAPEPQINGWYAGGSSLGDALDQFFPTGTNKGVLRVKTPEMTLLGVRLTVADPAPVES